jgi:hypothetical protein
MQGYTLNQRSIITWIAEATEALKFEFSLSRDREILLIIGLTELQERKPKTSSNHYDPTTFLAKADGNGSMKFTFTAKITLDTKQQEIDHKILMNHLDLLGDETFADFKFIVGDREFKVHRNILAAASPVFQKMFTSDMEEARSKVCTVENILPEIFEALLQFIYGGKLPKNLGEAAMKLYDAASFYDNKQLKEICEEEVPRIICKGNALEVFHWSEVHGLQNIKAKAWAVAKR